MPSEPSEPSTGPRLPGVATCGTPGTGCGPQPARRVSCWASAVDERLSVMLLAPASSLHTRRWAGALAGAGHRVVVASWQPGPPLPAGELRVAPCARRAAPAARLPLAG